MYQIKKCIILGVMTVVFVASGMFIMRQGINIWDGQMANIQKSVDDAAQTANAHSGQGFLGAVVLLAGFACLVLAGFTGVGFKNATLDKR